MINPISSNKIDNSLNPEITQSPEISRYEDTSEDGKRISVVHVHHIYPKATIDSYQHHDSLRDLCKAISHQRDPKGASERAINSSSFSSKNRGDLVARPTLSKGLKHLLGLENKTDQEIADLLEIKSIYKHNSEFNGHSYTDKDGNAVQIHSAISSSADRLSDPIQNLSVVQENGNNIAYTGRPNTKAKAEEQALFMLSHKLGIPLLKKADPAKIPQQEMPKYMKGKEGLCWNSNTASLDFPYVVYAIMSDSNLMWAFYTKTPEHNEKRFLKKEIKALDQLSKEPIVVEDAYGNVFKVSCNPILISQSFNSFDNFKFLSEGYTSPLLMRHGWDKIQKMLENEPEKSKILEPHIKALKQHFSSISKRLPLLHLFLHMNIILSSLNGDSEKLPTVLHCKSSTDRTGIGMAILATLHQFKRLGIPIPADLKKLTGDLRFKELFALNWIPTWHQRSAFSRDDLGISFGSGIQQNPLLLDCLPKRYLTPPSPLPAQAIQTVAFNVLHHPILALTQAIHHIGYLPENLRRLASTQGRKELFAIYKNSLWDMTTPIIYPSRFINEKGNKFRSKGIPVLSPLQKQENS
jgi:hypothetical protein